MFWSERLEPYTNFCQKFWQINSVSPFQLIKFICINVYLLGNLNICKTLSKSEKSVQDFFSVLMIWQCRCIMYILTGEIWFRNWTDLIYVHYAVVYSKAKFDQFMKTSHLAHLASKGLDIFRQTEKVRK